MKITNITMIECPACDGAGGDYEGGTAFGYIDGTPCVPCKGQGRVSSSQYLLTLPECECCGAIFVIEGHHNEAGVTCAIVPACHCVQEAEDLAYLESLAPFAMQAA
jgi:hypothetical protein